MSEISFGPSMNRSLLGTLNDFAFMAQQGNANRAESESPEELMRFLAQTPTLPLNGASPIALTHAAFDIDLEAGCCWPARHRAERNRKGKNKPNQSACGTDPPMRGTTSFIV